MWAVFIILENNINGIIGWKKCRGVVMNKKALILLVEVVYVSTSKRDGLLSLTADDYH